MILLDNIEEKISKLIRLKDFKDGKNIKKENCLLILQEKNVWQYTVYDDENLGFGFYSYNVTINWLDKFNFKCSCNCRNYKKYNSCLHIGAILWHYQDSLFKDNELENFIIRIDEYSHSIMTGFVIGEEFELNLSDYSTLNHQTDTTYEDVYIIRFEKNNYPYTTYYEGLFTDQLVPTVFHFYYDSITQDEIIIYFFLNNTSEWELMDVIHHSPS